MTNATCLGTGPARRIRRMSDWKWVVMLVKKRDGLKRWRRGCKPVTMRDREDMAE
jgi:hypothetical protein